ncbi:MAG: hypothetical protein HQ509_02640 [Candidatus Marinimicrobia bacterium]|nr:hypothetical protein [Candidatus Neomarinimicrobiota bacterium]
MLPFEHTWLPFIYLYSLGGILFSIGIWIIFRAKSIDLKRSHHRRWLFILFFGFVWYFSIHGLVNLAALDVIRPFYILVGLFIEFIIFIVVVKLMKSHGTGEV